MILTKKKSALPTCYYTSIYSGILRFQQSCIRQKVILIGVSKPVLWENARSYLNKPSILFVFGYIIIFLNLSDTSFNLFLHAMHWVISTMSDSQVLQYQGSQKQPRLFIRYFQRKTNTLNANIYPFCQVTSKERYHKLRIFEYV